MMDLVTKNFFNVSRIKVSLLSHPSHNAKVSLKKSIDTKSEILKDT